MPLFIIVFSYVCIYLKLLAKIRKKKESVYSAKNIEMVILDDPKEMNPQTNNINDTTWNAVKQWVKQRSFHYQVLKNIMMVFFCLFLLLTYINLKILAFFVPKSFHHYLFSKIAYLLCFYKATSLYSSKLR